jgi:hypothetical protein
MVNLQGLDVSVNLKNGDVIYGTVTGIDDDDGSISLEKGIQLYISTPTNFGLIVFFLFWL